MRLARDEEGYLTKDFFTSFKSSFKNATIFLLLIAIVIFVCCADFFFFGKSPAFLVKLLAFVIAGFLLCFSLIAVYFLPLTAQFENSIAGTFQTAVGITLQNIHWSICLLILNIILPLVILFQFLPLVVFGLPLPIFFQAYILNNIFRKYVPNGQFTPGSIARIQKKNP